MITDRDIAETMLKSKGFSRAFVVNAIWGSQQILARELGVTRFAVNHVIYFRRNSERIEGYILQRIRQTRPDLEKVWLPHWKRATRTRRRGVVKEEEKVGGLAA